MTHLVRRTLLVAGIVPFVGSGLSCGPTGSAHDPASPPPVRFDPPLGEFGRGKAVMTGDEVRFSTRLVNRSSRPIRLLSLAKSCGCTTIGGDGEGGLPALIPAGGSYPIEVSISTASKAGPTQAHVRARYLAAGGEHEEECDFGVQGVVKSNLVAIPPEFELEIPEADWGKTVVRSVTLADDWPGDGVGIRSTESTARERLKVRMRHASGRLSANGLDLRKHKELLLEYVPDPTARMFDETIRVVPMAPMKEVTIRLRGRMVPEVSISPSRLFIYGRSPGLGQVRLIELRSSNSRYDDIRPISIPEEMKLEALPSASSGMRVYRVSTALPSAPGRIERELVFEGGGRTFRVPATIVHDGGSR